MFWRSFLRKFKNYGANDLFSKDSLKRYLMETSRKVDETFSAGPADLDDVFDWRDYF